MTESRVTRVQGLGLRNAIINGDMLVWQRGTSFASFSGYTVDRWRDLRAGGTVVAHTLTQVTDVPNSQFQYALKLDCTTADTSVAAGEIFGMRQSIEGYNFKRFVGQTATLSFWIKAGKTGTMGISFGNAVDRTYVSEITVDSANTWEKKTITIDFDYSGGTWNYTNGEGLRIGFALLCGTTYQTTPDTWQSGIYFTTANQTNFCDNTDATCDVWITGVQLELGDTATDFEFLDFGTEMALCQRYLEMSYAYGTTPGTATSVGATYSQGDGTSTTSSYYGDVQFNTPKRAVPTMAIWDTAGNSGVVARVVPTNQNQPGLTFYASTGSFGIGTSGGTSGRGYEAHWQADAEL